MNKAEFIKAVASESNMSQKDVEAVLASAGNVVTKTIKNGEKIQLVGFGTFELRSKAARTGINPQTKEKVKIAACKVPALKFGKSYKELFN